MDNNEYINGNGEKVERHKTSVFAPPTKEQEEKYIEKAMRLDKEAELRRNWEGA
jgi:hypothetical protein